MEKKYSILMSVYKNDLPSYLKQSIESMLNQTIMCEQFVIVKDGPLNDGLDNIIDGFKKELPDLFTIISLNENVGLAQALNKGLEACRNELVARMDADDISLPIRCEKLLELFEKKPQLALAGTNIDEFYDDPSHIVSSREVPSTYEEICKFIKRRNPFNHPTVMFKKSVVLKCGCYGNIRRRQDFDLFSRMVNMGYYALNINESLLLFRSNEGNYKRRKSWGYCKDYIRVQNENYKRGYCSFLDLIIVACGQMAMFLLPISIMKWLSDRFLRKKKSK